MKVTKMTTVPTKVGKGNRTSFEMYEIAVAADTTDVAA